MFSKRGVSPVIATVLLLVLTLVIVGILAVFVIPFTDRSLEGSEQCLDVISKLSFDESPYNCIAETASINRTGFSVHIDSEDVTAFRMTLFNSHFGTSVSYDITSGYSNSNIRMLDSTFASPLNVPGAGETLTYAAKGYYDRIEVYPLLSTGDTCEEHDTIQITRCTSPEIRNKLASS